MEKEIKAGQDKKEEKPKIRQIIIETDGTNINIAKAEVAGQIELIAIINGVLGFLTNPPKQQ
jgi:NAD kinase